MVYIQEAHAADVWQMPSNVTQGVVFANPTSYQAREHVADSCVRRLNIRIPALIDSFDNRTDIAYTGWPDRLYVIDRDGRVAYKSAPGPFGFHPAELERALERVVGGTPPSGS